MWEISDSGVVELMALAAREGALGGVAFSPDGEQLLTGNVRVTAATIWDVGIAGGAEWANLPMSEHTAGMAEFTPDGDALVVTGDGMPAVVWDQPTGARRRGLGTDENPAWEIETSPDGDLVATIGKDEPPRAHVWDRRTGDLVFTVGSHGFFPERLAWSPDGDVLAVAGFRHNLLPGKTMIVDRAGQPVTELSEDIDRTPRDVVFSPDGEHLITQRNSLGRGGPSVDGVRVWDWADGEVLADIPVSAEVVAVDPSGSKIAVGEVARGASIWDLATGDRLATLVGHNGDVFDVAYSPDGDIVATAGTDGTVRLWNAESGTEQLVLRNVEGPVTSVAFSPDGDRLASTGTGVARVWALDIDDLIGIAEDRLTRSLTDDECRQYLHVQGCPE